MYMVFFEFRSIVYCTETKKMIGCNVSDLVRYLKGVYSNKERFVSRFVEEKINRIKELEESHPADYNISKKFLEGLAEMFDTVEPFSFKEAFEITDREFQALVFSSINITDMIKTLGATRIKTDGINVVHKKYDNDGKFIGKEDYYNVYETHKVDGKGLGINEDLYVVKCWCTSTNKEHWIWIDEKFKYDPLNAIASTFVVHKNIIPHIKALKRQGDLLLVEMNKEVTPEGEMVSLTKEQYFSLLEAQS